MHVFVTKFIHSVSQSVSISLSLSLMCTHISLQITLQLSSNQVFYGHTNSKQTKIYSQAVTAQFSQVPGLTKVTREVFP